MAPWMEMLLRAFCYLQASHLFNNKVNKKEEYNRNKMYLHAIHLEGSMKFLWYLQLTGELFLRTVSLKFYFLKSFYLFLLSGKKIALSRNAFSDLAKTVHKNLSVREVVKNIRVSLDDKSI